MSRVSKDVGGPSAFLTAISVRAPPFWRRSPEAWFLQLEEQFALGTVTTGSTKFNHAVVGLDKESAALVVDVLSKYSQARLTDQLIRHLSVGEAAKLNHLLTHLTLHDHTQPTASGNELTGW